MGNSLVMQGMNKAHETGNLRCRKRNVNQSFRNSVIKFELSRHVRNTLYMDEKKNEKPVYQNYILRLIKGSKVFFVV